MITGSLGFRRRRESNRTNDQQQQQPRASTKASSTVYADLAKASGGVVIQTSKSELLAATTIVTGSSSSAQVQTQRSHWHNTFLDVWSRLHQFELIFQVLLLQAARSPGKSDNFTFTVDESVKNLTIYINGRSVTFTLISPSGDLSMLLVKAITVCLSAIYELVNQCALFIVFSRCVSEQH